MDVHLLRETLRWSHSIIGLIGLVAFWFPIFARKGGPLHTRAGTIFAWSAYGACATAAVSCTLFLSRAAAARANLPDQPPVNLDLCFTGPTHKPGPAALPLKVCPRAHQPRALIFKRGQLNLQPPFPRLRPCAENFKNQTRTVNHLHFPGAFEVTLLDW